MMPAFLVSGGLAVLFFILWVSARSSASNLRDLLRDSKSQVQDLNTQVDELQQELKRERYSREKSNSSKNKPKPEVEFKPILLQAPQAEPEPDFPEYVSEVSELLKPIAREPKASSPVIVTRTGKSHGASVDTWLSERIWAGQALDDLLELYRTSSTVKVIALRLNVDSKDVVYGIARHAFGCQGELEDLSHASNNGKNWGTSQKKRIGELLAAGLTVEEIALEFERTQLAIVWQAIDNGFIRSEPLT